MLETLREYGQARLAGRGEVEALRRRHLDYYVRVAEQAEALLEGPDQRACYDRLERDHDNVRWALGWAGNGEARVESGLRLAASICRFWAIRGHVTEGRAWLDGLLDSRGTVTPRIRARALDGAGWLARENADYERSAACHRQALAIWREVGDRHNLARTLNGLGTATSELGDLTAARGLFEESVKLFLKDGNRADAGFALSNLGITARLQGQLEAARAYYERAAEIARESGNRRHIGMLLHSLGNLAMDRRDPAEASVRYHEALAISHELGNWASVARCLEGIADVLAMQHRELPLAAHLRGAAAALRDEIGVPVTQTGRANHERSVAQLETLLGRAAFETAWQCGRAVSREDAVSLALDVPANPKDQRAALDSLELAEGSP